MAEGLAGTLQHPRRSLGDRHRSQAIKFQRLANADASQFKSNMDWAEQNARQALLHDFTHVDNWRALAGIKLAIEDEMGLRALLSDLFAVLGRDPDQVAQLSGVPILSVGSELLEAALLRDPLDPDAWFTSLDEDSKASFCARFATLDLSDPRCNVLFGRRVERLWVEGDDGLCIPLARSLLSQRPQNFEMWTDLGRAHERAEAFDEAWFCYDQAQTHGPHTTVRDAFRERMKGRLDSGKKLPWSQPSIDVRDQFLERMQTLASRFVAQEKEPEEEEEVTSVNQDEVQLTQFLDSGEFAAAFFLSRRLVTRGETWAQPFLERAESGLSAGDEVHIP
jgi:hypothetical protein